MTDFVLSISKQTTNEGNSLVINFNKIKNYATFLNQPLKLEMFVPCDDDGSYWKYPPTQDEWEWVQKDSADAEQSFKQKEFYYRKAKEKVLFEGVYI